MNLVLVIEISDIIYLVVVGMSWVTYPYFEGLVFFLLGILILLIVIVSLNMAFTYIFNDPVLRWVIPFPKSNVHNGYISRDITNIYYLNFLIRIIFNNVPFLSVF